MIDLSTFTPQFLQALDATFGNRVWFVGLQGSYSRGEATKTSDMDWVVILDQISPADIDTYHKMLAPLPHRELICGFFSGKAELLHWEASDLFQFYHDTTPIRGSLDALLSRLDDAAVARAIKTNLCNIYHGCVHNMLHDHSDAILCGLYKAASIAVQAICFRQTGQYFRHQKALLEVVSPEEQVIVKTFLHLKTGGAVDFRPMSETLFRWVQTWVQNPALS